MRSFKRTAWVVFAALMPLAVVQFLQVPRVALGCFTDAVFYLSYARQFEELVLRYGFPYYATRFGGILPEALSEGVFGEITGIWVLRWVLSAGVSIALFLTFRKRFGLLAGLLASIFWSFSPVALRLICTTYVDSTAVPFLILGCCLFLSGAGGAPGGLLAGILFGFAASAHLYAAFALALLLPLLISSRWPVDKSVVRAICWVIAGFIGTFVVGWIWYWSVWGMPALFSPTLEVMNDIAAGKGECWKRPILQALKVTPAWFVPFVLIPPAALIAWKGSALMRGAALSLIISAGFFWGGDLFGKAFILSLPFDYSFLLPVTILSAGILCGEVLRMLRETKSRTVFFFLLAIGTVLSSFLASRSSLAYEATWVVMIAGSGTMFLLKESLRTRFILSIALFGITSSTLLVASTWTFARMLQGYGSKDIPILELAAALGKELPRAVSDGRIVRFWCDDHEGTPEGIDRRMIDSFWLNTFGKLQGEHEQPLEFLKMSPQDANAIALSGVDRIVILDQDARQVSKAVQMMRGMNLPFHLQKSVSLHADSNPAAVLEVAILERDDEKKPGELQVIDLKNCQVTAGGRQKWSSDGMVLISGPGKWVDFAKLPVGKIRKGDKILVECKIVRGRIRFALNDRKNQICQYVEKWAMRGDQEITLRSPGDFDDGFLTFYNLYPNGARSELSLKAVAKAIATQ